MSAKTSIEWTDATWNPVSGCSKVSQGCKNCYAERVFPRAYGRDRWPVGIVQQAHPIERPRQFTDVRTHPDRLDQPLRWKRPRRIFVNSMSDLFHDDVPEVFIDQVFAVMALSQRHTFQILTKRPRRVVEYFEPTRENLIGVFMRHIEPSRFDSSGATTCVWPLPNVWLGVSVEDQKTADERIPLLLQTPAAVRFVSYEPALGPVNFSQWIPQFAVCGKGSFTREQVKALSEMVRAALHEMNAPVLDWIIAGGESGPHARPAHPDWFRSARDQCQAAGLPFFFKQWGEWAPTDNLCAPTVRLEELSDGQLMERVGKKAAGRQLDGREWNEFPEVRA